MDFIAIDLDKHDVWEAFRQPVPVKEQMYVKTANWNPGTPSEEVECPPGGDPNDVCYTDDQEQQQSFGQATPTFGNSGTGAGTTHQDPGSNPGDGFGGGDLSDEQIACYAEQTAEANVDTAAQAAADEINSKEPDLEHATFGVRDGNSIVTVTVSTGDSETADVVSLYAALRANGYDMADVVFFIHSHPSSTITDASWAAAEDFTNQFPSDNDLRAYAEFLEDAVEDGANAATWLSDFTAYVVGPDNVNREYGNFTLDGSGDSVSSPDVERITVHPEPGSDEYQRVQETADSAETDAANGCE